MARDHPVLVQNSRFHTQGWRANGDVSIILSQSNPDNPTINEIMASERYVTGYARKGNTETGALSDMFSDMVNCADKSTGATGKSLVTKLIMNTVKRDVSAVEVSYELSSLPLYRCTYTFQNISLSGTRILDLTKNGPTLTKNTPLDRYLCRDVNDVTSLYNFVCRGGKVPVVSGSHTQAFWPLSESYCRTMLLLHWPNWKHLNEIKLDEVTWEEKMQEFLQNDQCPNFVKADVERAKQRYLGMEETNDNDNEDDNEQGDAIIDEPDWMQIVQPQAEFEEIHDQFLYDDGGEDYDWTQVTEHYPDDLGTSFVTHLDSMLQREDHDLDLPDVNIACLKDEQLLAYNVVMKALQDYHEKKDTFKPLRLIVAGTAGSGKSFLIKCLLKTIRSLFKSNKSVQVVCPTGSSANLINGVTLHSFFKIPMSSKSKEMSPPEGSSGETLQNNSAGLKVLLLDERSLVGATTMGWMEFHSRCGMEGGSQMDKSWGGLPVVVFMGDDVQLPPVLDSPIYNCKSKISAAIHGVLSWQEFSESVTLRKSIRQQAPDQQQFRDVLFAIREYKATPQQAQWLQQFQWSNLKKSHGDSLLHRIQKEGLFAFPTNNEVWEHNK